MPPIELMEGLDLGMSFLPISDVVTRPSGRLIAPVALQQTPRAVADKLNWTIGWSTFGAILGGVLVTVGYIIATAIEEG